MNAKCCLIFLILTCCCRCEVEGNEYDATDARSSVYRAIVQIRQFYEDKEEIPLMGTVIHAYWVITSYKAVYKMVKDHPNDTLRVAPYDTSQNDTILEKRSTIVERIFYKFLNYMSTEHTSTDAVALLLLIAPLTFMVAPYYYRIPYERYDYEQALNAPYCFALHMTEGKLRYEMVKIMTYNPENMAHFHGLRRLVNMAGETPQGSRDQPIIGAPVICAPFMIMGVIVDPSQIYVVHYHKDWIITTIKGHSYKYRYNHIDKYHLRPAPSHNEKLSFTYIFLLLLLFICYL